MRWYCGIDLHSTNSVVAILDAGGTTVYRRRLRNELRTIEAALEKMVRERAKTRAAYRFLHTIPGVGDILALTIMLETGEIGRFRSPGRYASYSRCVTSTKWSNNKKKGVGNRKNGNRYLAWAFIEAANTAVRNSEPIKRFYERKRPRGPRVLALKAVAHKLARAAYYVMRDQVPFEVSRSFA